MEKIEKQLNLMADLYKFDDTGFPDWLADSDDELSMDELDCIAAAGEGYNNLLKKLNLEKRNGDK